MAQTCIKQGVCRKALEKRYYCRKPGGSDVTSWNLSPKCLRNVFETKAHLLFEAGARNFTSAAPQYAVKGVICELGIIKAGATKY